MSTTPPIVPPNLFSPAPATPPTPRKYLPHVAGAHSPGAWKTLTDALGTGLQGGMYRAQQAQRRLARLR